MYRDRGTLGELGGWVGEEPSRARMESFKRRLAPGFSQRLATLGTYGLFRNGRTDGAGVNGFHDTRWEFHGELATSYEGLRWRRFCRRGALFALLLRLPAFKPGFLLGEKVSVSAVKHLGGSLFNNQKYGKISSRMNKGEVCV